MVAKEHGSSTVLFSAQVSPSGESISGGSEQTDQIVSSQEQNDPSMFFELMSPTSAKPDQMSASSLAYLGDVVFELFIRSRYVWPSQRMSGVQKKVVSIVRGKHHLEVSITNNDSYIYR